ncbi:PREDICTED: endonuclease 1 [Tarenaya hassleriana]|uniref:endonuclease 1 n=1 Tax=Tarenaya hassleriana TaxID=28532 RepID=UPI00053C2F59|nr:PREDICTED: endonuclease 1 [Tarenaya hassleriana]
MVIIRSCFKSILVLSIVASCWILSVHGWSKEGHILTCRIAQNLLESRAAREVENLLPEYVEGDLSALCTWPDKVRIWYNYRWSSPLHYINTPDNACNYNYMRDCHDQYGAEDRCVDGAIQNFTSQLQRYVAGTDLKHNMTEALLFLSHFMGDIHQPMHVGFTSDEGGNTIELRWFRRKSNLHHVWDRDIILTALADYYDKNLDLFQRALERNITDGSWTDDIPSWTNCSDLFSCPQTYASESIKLACDYGYKGVTAGDTLSDEYFDSRLPIVMERIARGGVRLAMVLNRVFGEAHVDVAAA